MILRLSIRVEEPVTGTERFRQVLLDTATFSPAKWATIKTAVDQMATEVVDDATPKIPATL